MPYKRKSKRGRGKGRVKKNERKKQSYNLNIPSSSNTKLENLSNRCFRSALLDETGLRMRIHSSISSQYDENHPKNSINTTIASSTTATVNTTKAECRIPKKRYLMELAKKQKEDSEATTLDQTEHGAVIPSLLPPYGINESVSTDAISNSSCTLLTEHEKAVYLQQPITTINGESSSSYVVCTTNVSFLNDEQPVYIVCTENSNYSPISDDGTSSFKIEEQLNLDGCLTNPLYVPCTTDMNYNIVNTLCTTSPQIKVQPTYQQLSTPKMLKYSPTGSEMYSNKETTLTDSAYVAYTTELSYNFVKRPSVHSSQLKRYDYELVGNTSSYMAVEQRTSIKRKSSYVICATHENCNSVYKSSISINLNKELDFDTNAHKYFNIEPTTKGCSSKINFSSPIYSKTDFTDLPNTFSMSHSDSCSCNLTNSSPTTPLDLTKKKLPKQKNSTKSSDRSLIPLLRINSEAMPTTRTSISTNYSPISSSSEINSNSYSQTYLTTILTNSSDNNFIKPLRLKSQKEVNSKTTCTVTTNCNSATINRQSTSKDAPYLTSNILECNNHRPTHFTLSKTDFSKLVDNTLALFLQNAKDQNSVVSSPTTSIDGNLHHKTKNMLNVSASHNVE